MPVSMKRSMKSVETAIYVTRLSASAIVCLLTYVCMYMAILRIDVHYAIWDTIDSVIFYLQALLAIESVIMLLAAWYLTGTPHLLGFTVMIDAIICFALLGITIARILRWNGHLFGTNTTISAQEAMECLEVSIVLQRARGGCPNACAAQLPLLAPLTKACTNPVCCSILGNRAADYQLSGRFSS